MSQHIHEYIMCEFSSTKFRIASASHHLTKSTSHTVHTQAFEKTINAKETASTLRTLPTRAWIMRCGTRKDGIEAHLSLHTKGTLSHRMRHTEFNRNSRTFGIDVRADCQEYNEFVGSDFDDLMALFVDGVNVAALPNGDVVSINNINNDVNSEYFNDKEDGSRATEYDGFTNLLITASFDLEPRQVSSLKLAIADVADGSLDSSLVIRGESFIVDVY